MLGTPCAISGIDISELSFAGLPIRGARFTDCVAYDTDFQQADLRGASFDHSILESARFDGASLENADFERAEVVSIFVYDQFDSKTSAVLTNLQARQWLYSKGAKVQPTEDLNPYLGQPWYDAAREVTRTLQARIAGTHQATSLAKGTRIERGHREFAKEFVEYLSKKNILTFVVKSKKTTGSVVKVNPIYRDIVDKFADKGIIDDRLKPFFRKHLSKHKR